MDTVLLQGWLGGAAAIPVVDEASVLLARSEVRERADAQGLAAVARESLVVSAGEIARNALVHAGGGLVVVRTVWRAGVPGVEVIAADRGPGIADPTAALGGAPRRTGSLGVGLGAARRLADEMDLDVRIGEGTCVAVRKFASPVPRSEVGVLARPIAGGEPSGDQAVFVRKDSLVLVAVADGVGHGSAARESSDRAVELLLADDSGDPAEILRSCDAALQGARGAAMSIVRIDSERGELVHASCGNVSVHLYEGPRSRRFGGASRTLGGRPSGGSMHEERRSVAPSHMLLLHTDGLSARIDLSAELALRRQPPVVIAHQLLERHGQASDDALALVLRLG